MVDTAGFWGWDYVLDVFAVFWHSDPGATYEIDFGRRRRSWAKSDFRRSYGRRFWLLLHGRMRIDSCGSGSALYRKRHESIHTEEPLYPCNYCDKAFDQSHDLTIHIRTHTGEKLYLCSLCPKKFSTSSNLGRHQVKHSNKRSYPCSEYGRGFSRKDDVLRHRRKSCKKPKEKK
ncbi:hypothetical protein NPIL_357261 [Nephila pilipes]|uniref:C2H2-type domain-containing protein n=1 Tax=Nephila pilipes TaxID=299642 RepID=A0A8X6TS14_NEPPI|nr:hypothetical protein NPIL_357261 [Nephila pilipes]